MIAYFLGLLALSFVSGAVGYIIRGEVDRKRVWALQQTVRRLWDELARRGKGIGGVGMSAAEVFPVGEFIRDELRARGWSVCDLAGKMGGDPDVNHCALDLVMLAPDPKYPLGEEMAHQLAGAFGTSADLWENLDRAWREEQG